MAGKVHGRLFPVMFFIIRVSVNSDTGKQQTGLRLNTRLTVSPAITNRTTCPLRGSLKCLFLNTRQEIKGWDPACCLCCLTQKPLCKDLSKENQRKRNGSCCTDPREFRISPSCLFQGPPRPCPCPVPMNPAEKIPGHSHTCCSPAWSCQGEPNKTELTARVPPAPASRSTAGERRILSSFQTGDQQELRG